MSYFAEEPRKHHSQKKDYLRIGPQTYHKQQQKSTNRAYAPFGSKSTKNGIVKSTTIGPGSYQIHRNIVKPNLVEFENDKCIIVKLNNEGGYQFKSQLKRFIHECKLKTPGPGSYESKKLDYSRPRIRTKSCGKAIRKMKESYESEYLEKRKPTLHSDPPVIAQAQTKSAAHKPKGITRWSLNHEERFKTEPKQLYTEEDQSHVIQKINAERKKNNLLNQSPFFASNSVKSCFDEMVYKTSNPIKVEVRKMFGFQDERPGPGTYEPIVPGKKRLALKKFEFFGSTMQRFPSELTQSDIGPGHYMIEQKTKFKPPSKCRNLTVQQRPVVEQEKQEMQVQATGAKDCDINVKYRTCHNVRLNNGQGAFGSDRPRFQQANKEISSTRNSEFQSFVAIEDQIRKNRIQQAVENRQSLLRNRNYPIFISQSKRNCFQDCKHFEESPFGIYEVGNSDIGTKLRKQQQYFQQFSDCNLYKPGFMSSEKRFTKFKPEEETHKNCWCRIRDVEKRPVQQSSSIFNSKGRREVFEKRNDGPAVGQYSRSSTFIKNSFNSKFVKQNLMKSRKAKASRHPVPQKQQ